MTVKRKKQNVFIRSLAILLSVFIVLSGNSMLILAEGLAVENVEQAEETSDFVVEESEEFSEDCVSEETEEAEEAEEAEEEVDCSEEQEVISDESENTEDISEEEECADSETEEAEEEVECSEEQEVTPDESENTEDISEEEECSDSDAEESEDAESQEIDEEEESESNEASDDEITTMATSSLIASGTWKGIEWSIDKKGKLSLEQDGSYVLLQSSSVTFPWENYKDKIKSIYINAMIYYDNARSEIELRYDFYKFKNLQQIDFGPNFTTEHVVSMADLFKGVDKLKKIDLSRFNTENVVDMSYMFWMCESLEEIDLSSLNTEKVTDMSGMFGGCCSLEEIDLSPLNTQKVTDMSHMFYECSGIKELNLSAFKTKELTDMSYMFAGCSSLTSIDISHFNVNKVTTIESLFEGCKSLSMINIEGLKFSKVTSFEKVFSNCSSLKSVDVSAWNTGNAETMSGLFQGCSLLQELDLSNFDTSKVRNIAFMFDECTNIEELDLSNFDTSSAEFMYYMFSECKKLTRLNVSSFDTSKVRFAQCMFMGCSSLTQLDLRSMDFSAIEDIEQFLDGSNSLTKIWTPKYLSKYCYLPASDEKNVWIRVDNGDIIQRVDQAPAKSEIERVPYIKAEQLIPNVKKMVLNVGQSEQIKIRMLPKEAVNRKYRLSISNEKVVAKQSNGYILAKSPGKATLTATASDGAGAKATIEVVVVKMAKAVDLSFDVNKNSEDEFIFVKGKEITPILMWEEGEAWTECTYSFSNDTAVFENGKIVPKNAGSGVVTLTTKNLNKEGPKKSVSYRVYEEAAESVVLNTDKVFLDARNGVKKAVISASIPNVEAAYDKILFHVPDNNMFTVIENEDNSITVQLIDNQPGKIEITAMALDGSGKKAVCTVISGSFVNEIGVSTSLDCDNSGNYLIREGRSVRLTTEVHPKEATNKKLEFISSDESIATVDANGTVKALRAGEVVITANATDGSGVSAECKMLVTRPATGVSLTLEGGENNKVVLTGANANAEFSILASVRGADGTETGVSQDVSYSVSGAGAKNVEYKGNGRFEASAPGVILISVTTKDGSKKKATLKVTIEQKVYAFEVAAPKNTGSYRDLEGIEHWIVYGGKKNVTLTPVVTYNNSSKTRPADNAYRKYEIIMDETAAGALSYDKKGTGIVVPKSASAGMYEVTIRNTDSGIEKKVVIDVVELNNTHIKSVTIGWPASVKRTDTSEQPVAAGSKIKLTGILNNGEKTSGYKLNWSVEGEGNLGSATIKAGRLDLTKAVEGDEYIVSLTIRKGEESKTVSNMIIVTAKVSAAGLALVSNDESKVTLPTSLNVQSELNGKSFHVEGPTNAAGLYSVSGGKNGVLTVTEETDGYKVVVQGVGSTKLTIKALDGSNVKKNISIKVVAANNPVTKLSTAGKTYYVETGKPIAIPYTLTTKNGEAPTDTRVEWKVSSGSLLMVTSELESGAWGTCITNESEGYLWLVPATEMTGKVTVTGTTLDGSKKSVKVSVNVVNNSKGEVTQWISLKEPVKVPLDKTGKPIVLYGKNMKAQMSLSSSKAKNKNVIYSIEGKTKAGERVTEADLKKMGVTFKKGTISASKKCSFHGVVKITAGLDYLAYADGKVKDLKEELEVCIQPPIKAPYIGVYKNTGGTIEIVNERYYLCGDQAKLGLGSENSVNNINVKWEVSDPSVATIDSDGYFNKKRNNCWLTITATALDGSKQKITTTFILADKPY